MTSTIRETLPAQYLHTPGAPLCPQCRRANRVLAQHCMSCGAKLVHDEADQMQLAVSACTSVGRVREHNEDTVLVPMVALPNETTAQLCIVADGLGGANAGEVASRLAAHTVWMRMQLAILQRTPSAADEWRTLLCEAVRAANRAVYRAMRADAARAGMGTTLTAALVVGDMAHIAHVGDSRAYHIHADGITRLTDDHTLGALLQVRGHLTEEEATQPAYRDVLWRALGMPGTIAVDSCSVALKRGELLLLCSDGLVKEVADDELAAYAMAEEQPQRSCEHLVALAEERGGADNISVALLRRM